MVNDILKNRKQEGYRILKLVPVIGLLLIGIIGFGVYEFFFNMSRLPTGKYLTEETSSDGTYTLKAYISIGGATTSDAIRGELVFNKENNKTINIYWNYREDTADIEWINNDTVVINGHTLEVPTDRFDFRNQ